MEISQSSAMSALNWNTNATASAPPPPPPPKDELSDYMAESRGDEEVRSFMDSIMEMEASGEFDAAALAESAPDSMKAYAEENGIDLESFFTSKHEDFQSRSAGNERPPPPPGGGMQEYQQTAQYGQPESDLFDTLTSSVQVNAIA